ncbi:glycoside hydrolase family 3 N-terminal domain-containing protein [Isoptericola sp. b441]|uniref:Glycoside hydrolase family 3 N-terminal domain-containing protein n=1 Tax=Actinotalea lenta TaxID=3064654 RepID=A0ABT9D6Y9_9CELL|nr:MULTISPECIES: glycoside hydrolase family 3 N-terminal domain-containing protein [unclassified Isoptericola]MDO8106608.1 glycoside hydrolase family 3 N-terminal domain-containing protein [Isoptericola sp. b441]MDO8121684.1 glycoside hydrolase family 3 N-terminal domain-containing protein [Isoptericola sp. b490]
MPEASARVRELLARMTIEEKVAQLVGFWVDQGGEVVAPMAGEMATSGRLAEATQHGLGHLTRVYGTRPVDPAERMAWLWAEQRRLRSQTRLGIPALVHEECLTGLAAWQAATYPTPLAWGATFDPDLVREAAGLIGASMRDLGVHQGLAPVLDVIRDPRWGRVDECIAEDPYLVGTVGTAYVQGLQGAGVHATLKHFLGYSASRAGRNHAPVEAGPRTIADVFLPPFEMALLDGGARSVMNAYVELDGIPVASSSQYLTDVLRDGLGFDGVVVADYFAVAFLHLMHAVAADRAEAATLALTAGIDVELPGADAYPELVELVRSGTLDESWVDRAVLRVLNQKESLGLLDATFEDAPPTEIDLDPPEQREMARRLAEESVVLLTNDGHLPLAGPARVAVIGPNADRSEALMGCYSFVNHVMPYHPDEPAGIEVPTVLEALRSELPGSTVRYAPGCTVEGEDRSAFDEAVALARESDVAILVMGDQAGLFGRGTVGEGNDSESLELPGVQRELVEAVQATGTPVVLVLVTGRPYAIGWAVEGPGAAAAVVQSFFPGEEGGTAIARVLSGRVNPSGRLPITMPRSAGAQPYSYLHPILGGPSDVTAATSAPVLPFGHGLSYTTVEHSGLAVDPEVPTDGTVVVDVVVRNTGDRAGTDVVQLYGRDVHAAVTRPVAQLLGYRRVDLEPGESASVRFAVPTARLAYTDRSMRKVVEPGEVELWVGPSCEAKETSATVRLTGAVHAVTTADPRLTTSEVLGDGLGEVALADAAVPLDEAGAL